MRGLTIMRFPGNYKRLNVFHTEVQRLWRYVLQRRSQKGRRWAWPRVRRLTRIWLPQPPILHPCPDERLIVSHSRQEPCEVVLSHTDPCGGPPATAVATATNRTAPRGAVERPWCGLYPRVGGTVAAPGMIPAASAMVNVPVAPARELPHAPLASLRGEFRAPNCTELLFCNTSPTGLFE